MSATSMGQIGLDLVVNQKQFNSQMSGIQSLARKTGRLLVAAFGVKQLVKFSKKCIELSSDLQEVQNVANVAFPNMTAQMDKFAKSAASNFGLSETMAKKYSSLYGVMAKQFGFTERAAFEMGSTLAGLAGDVASFYNMTQDEAYTKLKAVFSGETEVLKDIGVVMTQDALDAYALANGFNKTTKSMTEAEKVALRYSFIQKQLSAATGDFLRTSDSWQNQTRLLKLNLEQLGATIGGSFINAFKPLISTLNVVIGKFTDFAKVVSDSLGKIFGWKYEETGGGIASDLESGAGSANDIASGIGTAAKKAEKLKRQLRDIDELSILSLKSESSSSGSGSTGSASSSGRGQWVQTDSIFKGYESELDSLYKLGEHIGDTIQKSLNDINWSSVYQGARNFGRGLADFLNGLISPETFGTVGKTIAGSLNTAIKAALAFAKKFDFHDFGVSLGTGINEFFEEFDFNDLANCLNTWVDGLEDTIAGFLETVTWDDILNKTVSFLGDLELDTVGVIISGFVIKRVGVKGVAGLLAKALKTVLKGGISLSDISLFLSNISILPGTPAFDVLAGDLILKIDEAIEKLLPDFASDFLGKLGAGIVTGAVAGSWFPGAGTIAGAIIGGILGALDSIKIDGKSILKHIVDGIFNYDLTNELLDRTQMCFKDIKKSFEKHDWLGIGKDIVLGIFYGFSTAISGIFEPVADLFEIIVKAIKNIFGIHSPAETMKPLGENILLGIVEGFKNAFFAMPEAIQKFYANYVKPWFTTEKWKEQIGSIQDALSSKWTSATNWWNSKPALRKISATVFNIKSELQSAWESAKNWWNSNKPNLSAITANIKLPRITISWDTKSIAAKALQKLGLNGFPNFSVRYYAQGGFPEDGWFRAKHGEIMGKFDNGKSVVANNNQITDGISSAVYRGNQESNILLRQEIEMLQKMIEILTGILEKETGISADAIFSSVKKSADSYTKITGKPAFS